MNEIRELDAARVHKKRLQLSEQVLRDTAERTGHSLRMSIPLDDGLYTALLIQARRDHCTVADVARRVLKEAMGT